MLLKARIGFCLCTHWTLRYSVRYATIMPKLTTSWGWEPHARRTSGKAESTHQGGVAHQRYVDAHCGVADSGIAGSHCVACRCVGGVLGEPYVLVFTVLYAVLLIVFLFAVTPLRYIRWRYELRPDFLELKYGIIWRKHIVVPFHPCAEYRHEAKGPILRAFGLAECDGFNCCRGQWRSPACLPRRLTMFAIVLLLRALPTRGRVAMSSNGPIHSSMNPTSSGASTFSNRSSSRGAPFAASLLYLAGCVACCADLFSYADFLRCRGLAKLAEVLGFVSVDAFFRRGASAPCRYGAYLRGGDRGSRVDVPATPGTNLTKRNSASIRGS